MLDANMALATNRDDRLATPRMKGMKDLNFKRRTPGIMTPTGAGKSHIAIAIAIARSCIRAGARAGSITWSISSTGSRPKPVMPAKVAWPIT